MYLGDWHLLLVRTTIVQTHFVKMVFLSVKLLHWQYISFQRTFFFPLLEWYVLFSFDSTVQHLAQRCHFSINRLGCSFLSHWIETIVVLIPWNCRFLPCAHKSKRDRLARRFATSSGLHGVYKCKSYYSVVKRKITLFFCNSLTAFLLKWITWFYVVLSNPRVSHIRFTGNSINENKHSEQAAFLWFSHQKKLSPVTLDSVGSNLLVLYPEDSYLRW